MGFFVSLLCICLFVYFGGWLGIKSCSRFYQKFFLHHKELVESAALYLTLLLGLALFSFISVIPFKVVAIFGFLGIGILSFSQSQLSTKQMAFFHVLLCFFIILALYPLVGNVFDSLWLALLWWLMWRIIVWFDRFTLTSLLVSLGWTMALVTTGLLIHTLPNALIAIVALLGTLTFLFASYQTSQKQPVLGKNISSLLGFLWAGVWVYFLSYGAFFQTLTAFGYYLFEGGFLITAFFCHRPFQTFLGKLLTNSQVASKAVRSIFSHILLLSFFATIMMRSNKSASLLLFILPALLLDLYMRLNNLECPVPSWRELFKNTRQGMTDFVDQVKQKNPVFKTVSSKKAPKKALKSRKKRKAKK